MLSLIYLLLFAFAVLYFFAWMVAMDTINDIARAKGSSGSNGLLWFIGFIFTPILPALIVIATPDKNTKENSADVTPSIEFELPSI